MKNLFKINIFTYLFLLLSILAGYIKEMIIIYFILIIHELGHYIIFKYYNIKVNKITLHPYGGMIDSNILINTNSKKILLISLGGIIAQIILYLIMIIFLKINIINTKYFFIFKKYNLYIILFNLIPIYPLDGFKIFNSILEMILPFKKSLNISIIFNYISIITFFYFLYINKVNNYFIIIFLLVNLINYIKNYKYILNKFYLERIIYDIEHNGIISVKNKENIYKNKYNYINGIKEEYYLKKFDYLNIEW